jgi:transcriptional regulator with XRE-family HTH domain
MERSGFPAFIEGLIKQSGLLKQEFARELGVKPPVLSQILSGAYQTPTIDLCIRFARVGRVSISRVLREAGRAEDAEQLSGLYAAEIRDVLNLAQQKWSDGEMIRLSPEERRILELWRSLDSEQMQAFKVLLHRSAQAARPAPRAAVPRRRRSR